MRKVFVRSLWTLLAIVILGSAVAFTAIWNGFIGYMPPVEDLQNPINRFATQIYSADGKVIGTWNFNRENRICVSYNDISPYLVQALVATEDVRFYDHSGVDFIALGRASSSAVCSVRLLPVAVLPSHSSLPSSSIPKPPRAPCSVRCRNR